MNIMFFDTETNGLPRSFDVDNLRPGNWPSMVQVAWIIVNEDGKEIEKRELLMKLPEGEIENPRAVAVHGKTTELIKEKGIEIEEVLKEFRDALSRSTVVVAHNINFDLGIIYSNFKNQLGVDLRNDFLGKKLICTKESSTDYCKIPSSRGYKWPSLSELHNHLFGKDFENAHDAMGDVVAMKNCYYELVKRNVI